LVHESGLQEDMDKWSTERNECMKWFHDKQEEEENGSGLHKNPMLFNPHFSF
jgi:hypothetical protein